MMTEQEFDALWQRAEATPHTTRLLEEYPVWRRQRRRKFARYGVGRRLGVFRVLRPHLRRAVFGVDVPAFKCVNLVPSKPRVQRQPINQRPRMAGQSVVLPASFRGGQQAGDFFLCQRPARKRA